MLPLFFSRHRSLNKDAPFHRTIGRLGAIASHPILNGLHHQYQRRLKLTLSIVVAVLRRLCAGMTGHDLGPLVYKVGGDSLFIAQCRYHY